MQKEVGLWIDHRQAVIVINLDQEEVIRQVASNMEAHLRDADVSDAGSPIISHNTTSEDGRDRRFENHLNRFYDEVITYLRDATAVLIMGPGEAKGELQKRLVGAGLGDRIVATKPADNLTDAQIKAAVRQYFQEANNVSNKIAQT